MRRLPARDRESVTERRERVLELHATGRVGWQIAFETGLSERTVQRHLRAAREGRPVCRQRQPSTLAKQARVAELIAQGLTARQIAPLVGMTWRTVRKYQERIRAGR